MRHDCGVPGPVYGMVMPTPSYVNVCVGHGGSATVDVPYHVAVTSWPAYVKRVGDASARCYTAGAAAANAARERTGRSEEIMVVDGWMSDKRMR